MHNHFLFIRKRRRRKFSKRKSLDAAYSVVVIEKVRLGFLVILRCVCIQLAASFLVIAFTVMLYCLLIVCIAKMFVHNVYLFLEF